ncbi:MAG: polysaccharide biosynthesis tyrosine autokinase [Nitrospirae bacterium]|nr:polysaccharide biosynthesis tyrosine autokinase [Nitrospirota bacterium]MBI5696170.1 polysaccharide biosynthesis tyrosine autokinase [Nitrospirota bacterium]
MATEELSIQEYIRVLRKRKWAAIAAFLVIFLSIAVATFLTTPVYRATAQVFIDPGVNAQLSFQQGPVPYENSAYIQTQLGILRSESIARKVISNLQLEKEFSGKRPSPFSIRGIKGFLGMEPRPKSEDELISEMTRKFLKRLDVEVVKDSNLISVSYESDDPQRAAEIVNATVQTYIERNLEMKVAPAREAMSWLDAELGNLKGKMTESTGSLQEFKREKGLIVTGESQTNISLQALTDLNSKVLTAEAARYEAEVKYQQVAKYAGDPDRLMSLPSVMSNQVIQGLRAQLAGLNKDIAEQSKKFGEKHPQMIKMKGEAATLNKQVQQEVDLVVNSLKNEYDSALRNEHSLKAALGRQKGEAMSYERRATEYELMKQDVEGSRNIYDTVLKKFQESNLMGNMSMTNVQFLDKAVVPANPYKPKKAVNIAFGLVLGAFSGIFFAFMIEFVDNTFKSPEEVETYLGLPFLGVVPTSDVLQDKKRENQLVAVANPKSPLAESFRSIRSSILLATGDTTPKVIQICSALHSEGKSTTSSNLAAIMALAGEKVVLIDGDMRKPRLHRVMKTSNGTGLSSLLTRQTDLDSVIKPTGVANLDFISSGPVSPNPGELLGSKTMVETVAALRDRYDRVIIDCPPYLGIADSSLLTPITDGLILVVRSGKTARDMVQKAVKSMIAINAKTLGVVLNDLSTRSAGYYYYYNYNYKYYNEDKKQDS